MDSILHKHEAYLWEAQGHLKNEPRRGKRVFIAATLLTPFGNIRVYSVHLECFTGIEGRVKQFGDVLMDTDKYMEVSIDINNTIKVDNFIICGDFNTLSHGIARLSPYYSNDYWRFLSIGLSEAQWWQKNIFSTSKSNYYSGRNFYDPYDKTNDITLKAYRGWYTAKLDWILLKGLGVVSKDIGNLDFSASDHAYLFIDFCQDSKQTETK